MHYALCSMFWFLQYITTSRRVEGYFRIQKSYFFLRCLTFLGLEGLCFGRSLERVLFTLAALFLWITLFLAARSTRDIVFKTASFVLVLLAVRIAISTPLIMSLLTTSFLFEDLKALLAVLVTGILVAALQFPMSNCQFPIIANS